LIRTVDFNHMQDVRLEKNIENLVFTHPETRCARGESPQV